MAGALFSGLLHAQVVPARPQGQRGGDQRHAGLATRVSDPCWDAEGVESLSLQAPSNVKFANPPQSTRLRLLWNKDFLVIRFDCQDQSILYLPSSYGPVGQRDLPYFKADAVEAFIDPVGDGRMYMEFQFSPMMAFLMPSIYTRRHHKPEKTSYWMESLSIEISFLLRNGTWRGFRLPHACGLFQKARGGR